MLNRCTESPGAPLRRGSRHGRRRAAAWPEELLIRLNEPAPGIAHLVPHPMGGQIYLAHRLYLFGERASDAAAEAQAAWQAWFDEHFAPAPAPAEASAEA